MAMNHKFSPWRETLLFPYTITMIAGVLITAACSQEPVSPQPEPHIEQIQRAFDRIGQDIRASFRAGHPLVVYMVTLGDSIPTFVVREIRK